MNRLCSYGWKRPIQVQSEEINLMVCSDVVQTCERGFSNFWILRGVQPIVRAGQNRSENFLYIIRTGFAIKINISDLYCKEY